MGLLSLRFMPGAGGDDQFHSSGMVHGTENAKTLGSGSTETFSQRRHVERNRSYIGRYGDANVVYKQREHMQPARMSGAYATPRVLSGVVARPIATPARSTFHEPSSRHYNPYG